MAYFDDNITEVCCWWWIWQLVCIGLGDELAQNSGPFY